MAFALLKHVGRVSMGLVERNLAAGSVAIFNNHQLYFNKNCDYKPVSVSNVFTIQTQIREYSKKRYEYEYNTDSDSESDDESMKIRVLKGNSEFWRRKMRTLHAVLDVNNDGLISYDDFVLLTEKFGSLGHLDEQHINDFKKIMKDTWESQWGEMSPYNTVNVYQYLTDMHHIINDKKLKKRIHQFPPFLFKAVDNDRSGTITLTKFKLFFRCLGLTDEDAAVSFAMIDTNGDGHLSFQEFVTLGRDYFLREDENHISKVFWGPLVEH